MPKSTLRAELQRPADVAALLKGAAARRRLVSMLGPDNDYRPSLIATARLLEERARAARNSRPEDETGRLSTRAALWPTF